MAYLGIIEGFYGKSYTFEQRSSLIEYLKQHLYNFYIYAPKEDRSLRTRSFKFETNEKILHLALLSKQYQSAHLDFGLAFSPLDLVLNYKDKKDQFLTYLLDYLTAVKPNIVALLFDDMKKLDENLGKLQNEIIKDVYALLRNKIKRFIVCPSYYTFDPILDLVFGKRPKNYFNDLIKDLPANIDIFWTGNKVISENITQEDILKANTIFKRKVFIWDNYPVNDGKKISNYLNLKPFKRDCLAEVTTGHAVNPMLEFELNKIPLITLPLIYQNLLPEQIESIWLKKIMSIFKEKTDINKVLNLLTVKGLQNLNADELEYLKAICKPTDNIYLQEILDFLNNKYVFDPNCLTDN